MKASIMLVGYLAVFLAGIAVAAPPGRKVGPTPKVVSQSHSATGNRTKPSSFAPHPTTRRVFGAPIQPPIMKHVAPRKKSPAPK